MSCAIGDNCLYRATLLTAYGDGCNSRTSVPVPLVLLRLDILSYCSFNGRSSKSCFQSNKIYCLSLVKTPSLVTHIKWLKNAISMMMSTRQILG